MNKRILILIIGIVIGAGLLMLMFILLRRSNLQPPVPNPEQGTGTSTFPIPGTGTTSADVISIRTKNGESIQTENFFKDPGTIEDPINLGYYYLGYHFVEGKGKDIPYVIEYIKTTGYFNIVLYKEPLAESRTMAEQYLMAHLGISASQMCELNYMVAVPHSVSEFYTSQNLGFSFCPGSVQIPE